MKNYTEFRPFGSAGRWVKSQNEVDNDQFWWYVVDGHWVFNGIVEKETNRGITLAVYGLNGGKMTIVLKPENGDFASRSFAETLADRKTVL